MKLKLFFILSFIIVVTFDVTGQETGEPLPEFNPDSVFIFRSPRPLISLSPSEIIYDNSAGFNMIISGNGFGFGGFFTTNLSEDLLAFASVYFSGARESDEFEYYDPITGEIIVPGKKNRLYVVPLMFGLQYYIFRNELDESFQPYIGGGLGPAFVLANSFQREFFNAIGYTQFNTRPGFFLGAGADIMSKHNTVMGLDIRYYYIPFGGDGLESVEGLPIYNFGGIFLALNIGWRF